jgi:xylulokinase
MKTGREHLLAFDLGTSYFKAAVVSSAGEVVALARRATPVVHPSPGLWEMSPGAVIETIVGLAEELSRALPAEGVIAGVCAASQANTFVLLDSADNAVTPFILWPDARAERAPLPDLGDVRAHCGLPAIDHEFTPPKLAMVLARPTSRPPARLVFLSDFLTHWLTGRWTADASIASLSGLADVHRCAWREEALARCGAGGLALGTLCRPGEVIGPVLPSRLAGLPVERGCVVVTGALDQYACMLGAGASVPGMVAESTGTVLSALTPAQEFDPTLEDAYQGPTWPVEVARAGAADRPATCHWARMAFSGTSACILEHYRSTFTPHLSFEDLDALAGKSCSPAVIHRLEGSSARSVALSSITRATPPGDVVLGIYHRVAEELALLLGQLRVRPTEIRSSGGGAKSRLWLDIKSRRLGVAMRIPRCTETTVLGAAILAGMGAGWGEPAELSRRWVRLIEEDEPRAISQGP